LCNVEKCPRSTRTLPTPMRSVGEVMAIGRTFREAYMKALRSTESGALASFEPLELPADAEVRTEKIGDLIRVPRPERPQALFQAFREGMGVEEAHQLSAIDPWFLRNIRDLALEAKALSGTKLSDLDDARLRRLKADGFSDRVLAFLLG